MKKVGANSKRSKLREGEYASGHVLAERYTVKRLIGRGGMGVVYLVVDHETDKKVALKTIAPQYTSSQKAVVRFMREARAVRKLEHPAIVKFFDAGRLEDNYYFTMEYIRGRTVSRLLRERKRFGLGSTIRILYLLCDALKVAHTISIHRDISPGNVMVTGDQMIKLLDFGLAKLLPRDEDGKKNSAYREITQKGVILGKRMYIAPEQREDASSVDHRADIYSLGVMFYEMLVGEVPLDSRTITNVRPELPVECDEFLARTLADSPDDRYSNVVEAGEALMNIYQKSDTAIRKG